VQLTHTQEEITAENNANVARSFTRNGLGQNGAFQNIPKDAEYQLKSNEYLLINYTNNSSDGSGNETKTVINEYYGPGKIIKPNFALTDSTLYNKMGILKLYAFAKHHYSIDLNLKDTLLIVDWSIENWYSEKISSTDTIHAKTYEF
jgi:hypothetical protein